MNWYVVFYFFSLADKIGHVFGVLSVLSCIGLGLTMIFLVGRAEYEKEDWVLWRKFLFTFMITSFISLSFWTLIPDRKDMLMIIAGGSVGEFLVNDPNAKELPSDITRFLRKEILEATSNENIKETLGIETEADKLKRLSKEELIKLLEDKK